MLILKETERGTNALAVFGQIVCGILVLMLIAMDAQDVQRLADLSGAAGGRDHPGNRFRQSRAYRLLARQTR